MLSGNTTSRRLFRPSKITSRPGNQVASSPRKAGSAVWVTIARASLGEPQVHGTAPGAAISSDDSSGSHAETRAPSAARPAISGSARE